MTDKDDGFAEFDPLLREAEYANSPWDGKRYVPDVELFRRLLTLPIRSGSKQTSGRPAKALDSWVAHELRRAGFPGDAVWPRLRKPRVLPEGLDVLEMRIEKLAEQLGVVESTEGAQLKPVALRRAIKDVLDAVPGSNSAYILGDFYAKQIDVGMSSWKRGPDLLISTKTMFSGYGKNLKNRHEEAIGEVVSLRRRHPMAAIGFVYLVRRDIEDEQGSLALLENILTRLRRPGEMYDATMLLVGHWVDEVKPTELVEISQPIENLSASQFFAELITAVLARTPIGEHKEVRLGRDGPPLGGLPDDSDVEVESNPS